MGILTGRKPKDATTLADPAGGRRDMPQPDAADATQNVASTIADPFAILPSPPAPCPTCGIAILWLPTTLDAWRCPTCFPPPIRKMIAARVVLVDVDSESKISPQWFKLSWVERDGRRSLITTPIRRAANATALDGLSFDSDCGGSGDARNFTQDNLDATGAKLWALNAGRESIQDDRLGPPLVDGVRVDDEAWWAIGSSDVVWKQFFEAMKKQ